MHDSSKVLMGSTRSNIKEVDNRKGSIAAGLIVRLKSDDTISVALADGNALGISLGRSLSDTTRTAICRKGLGVPVQLTNGFTPTIGAQVNISDTTGKAVASGAGATAMNATYATSTLTGVDEDGNNLADGCALIDFPGGL
jgi:hypothetical protein